MHPARPSGVGKEWYRGYIARTAAIARRVQPVRCRADVYPDKRKGSAFRMAA